LLNRDIYQKDPSTQKLVNEGVANVNDEKTEQALAVLRYELETFVCDGQYEKGLEHILRTYLSNIDQSEQPAVWVSGFYGSGKSHLVKMLRALWTDSAFADGATARGIATLPLSVSDQLKELTTQGKRYGGLHAASGTLGSSSSDKSVRLALLGILFKSAGLPQQYPVARFVMWLKQEKILDTVRGHVEASGHDWAEELDNFYVAEGLHAALVKAKPNLFTSTTSCVDTLNNLYPFVKDVSSDDMLKSINLALTRDGKLPLTLVALDEVQQYIGEDSQRSIEVQEVVEACSKKFAGKLLFIGTGQTAVTGTSNLKRLEGRFTIRVELSDSDVDAVIRQVILAKKPEAKAPLTALMNTNLGEISRHLSNTSLKHHTNDLPYFHQDYPILPVRRRFWENTLRVLDQTGTDSQLRNQLSMIHKVIQTNMDKAIGSVVPADFLFFDAAQKLLQSRILPRKVYEKTLVWMKGDEDDRLMARATGLIFLVNRLASSNTDIKIRADIDTIADLLVEDLTLGSSALRSKLPGLLAKCELLMMVGDEYRIQTEESSAWNDEFHSQRHQLGNEAHRVESERDERIRKRFNLLVTKLSLSQGTSKVPRTVSAVYDAQLPADAAEKLAVWVRDGWSIDENSVKADARQAGTTSPSIFVFIPKRSADDLRHNIIEFKAASATLNKQGIPNTAEGIEARAAMETTRKSAEAKIDELLSDAFSAARVFQGGGNEIIGSELQGLVQEAAANALVRLYPQFFVADHAGWSKAYEKAQKGAPDALKSVNDDGEAAKNPVCKAILAFIAGGKKGIDIRKHFEGANFGWPGDAVDGGLQVLLVAGLVRAHDDQGKVIDPKNLERKNLGKTTFKVESTTVTAPQRIQIRKLFQGLNISVTPGEELAAVRDFLASADSLAQAAGGDAPSPQRPNTSALKELRVLAGNEQLLALYNQRDELGAAIGHWAEVGTQITKRLPEWTTLKRLVGHAMDMPDAEVLLAQVKHIEAKRQLLDQPDPVPPLMAGLTQLLRDALNQLDHAYKKGHDQGMARLANDANWQQLNPEQRNSLLSTHKLTHHDAPQVQVADKHQVLATANALSLSAFNDRVAALESRFSTILVAAAVQMQPEAQIVKVTSQNFTTEAEIDAWLQETRQLLVDALKKGPVILRPKV